MSSDFIINAESRSDLGKGASRRLRHADKVPAILYGGGEEPASITVSHSDLIKQLENEAFYSSLLTVKLDGKSVKAVVKDLQRHAFKPKILHMDLQRVGANEVIQMHVPLHFTGEDVAPGVKAGGLMAHQMNELLVACKGKDLPEYIEIDVSALNIGDVLHISDIKMPADVESVELSHGAEHDQPVVLVQKTRGGATDEDEDGEEAEGETEE